jgi:hypothetical protein
MAPAVISQEQQNKLADSMQEFHNQLCRKHPSLVSDNRIIPILIAELKLMGLFLEYVSVAAVWGAFYAAVSKNLITIPPVPVVLTSEAIQKLVSKYPVVVTKERELTQRERSALAGISSQSGRQTAADRRAADEKRSLEYSGERTARNLTVLKSEFRKALADAEMITGRTHSESANLRREATDKVMQDPRFASVRS